MCVPISFKNDRRSNHNQFRDFRGSLKLKLNLVLSVYSLQVLGKLSAELFDLGALPLCCLRLW